MSAKAKNWRVGIDVGGTNTDAVLINEKKELVASIKSPTSPDVITGIRTALNTLLKQPGVDKTKIGYAMLGTTHCTNAIIERKRLDKVGIIRIGAPATTLIEPLADWPDDLREIVKPIFYIINGGHEFNGIEISPLDEPRIIEIAKEFKDNGIRSISIISVFSPVNPSHELRAKDIISSIIPEAKITLSHQVGYVGLLERENATILNSLLSTVAHITADSFTEALRDENLVDVQIYICQNDGTVMNVEYSKEFPVLTIACGPTNSIRGGSFLTGEKDAIIVDVGGTTTDCGVLAGGFPRESNAAVAIGGVKTNFRMPDVHSIGLGGGSIVRLSRNSENAENSENSENTKEDQERFSENDEITIGPDSVGFQVAKKALCFGGDVFTATDVAVGLGMVENLGDPSKVTAKYDTAILKKAAAKIKEMTEDVIDAMKTSAGDVEVILVGGGSILLPNELEGASKVLKPSHFGVANAIGAAISQVSGMTEKVYSLKELTREKAIGNAKENAIKEAIKAGAEPSTVEILSVEEIPLAYLGSALKIRVKAIGKLHI